MSISKDIPRIGGGNNSTSKRERNISIDILKFIAVLFITNSHMNYVYGDYSALATGGAIGDVLFFFCSGFTLFLGRVGRLDEWYKRRIRRIYPSVFGFAIVASICLSSDQNMYEVLLYGGGWFVSCIMIYYVVLYFIRRYAMARLKWAFLASSVIVLLWYVFLFDNKEEVWMYKGTYFKWCHYFLFMLMGAIVGVSVDKIKTSQSMWQILAKLVVCVIAFYGLQIAGGKNVYIAYGQILTLLPLMGIVWYMYSLVCHERVKMLFGRKGWNRVMTVIGGLCLEIYLVQMPMLIDGKLPFGIITRDDLQILFPANIPVLVVLILVLAYITRSLGRAFAQTFDSTDGYDWKKVFSLK